MIKDDDEPTNGFQHEVYFKCVDIFKISIIFEKDNNKIIIIVLNTNLYIIEINKVSFYTIIILYYIVN